MSTERILVTGAAGFIGFHVSLRLLNEGFRVLGLDNLNDYYDVNLKKARLDLLRQQPTFEFQELDLTDRVGLNALFDSNGFDYVLNLAAQAGVRYSISNPYAYLESNMHGFLNILEACRHHKIKHLVYASSSSVYGANRKMPFSTHHNVDHPISLYAASKKSNELMAHTYSSLFGLPTTGLRFFTVYGPYGRPDMAIFLFTKYILEGKPIDVFNNGRMRRDFTYIDDIVEGIVRLLPNIAQSDPKWNPMEPDPAASFAPYRIYNIGNNKPIELTLFIDLLEQKLGMKAIRNMMPMQSGDVEETYADVSDLAREVNFSPSTAIEDGIGFFVDWYLDYYKIKSDK
jgi:UDP-glucuronate 4-epimerase